MKKKERKIENCIQWANDKEGQSGSNKEGQRSRGWQRHTDKNVALK